MDRFPATVFDGYLKQIDSRRFTDQQAALFDLLFPSFRAPRTRGVASTIRPRRFAGNDLPHSQYYSVCMDKGLHVDQTLAHELRAYRNPRDIGYIDVLDLAAQKVRIEFRRRSGTVVEVVEPDNAIAVMIHDLDTLPAVHRQHRLKVFEGEDGEIGFFKFPYTVARHVIEGTFDLRFPSSREWFYEYFSASADTHRQALSSSSQLPIATTTALSRFTTRHELPRRRRNFWEMLPTLLNPDLGGGDPLSTGSTILTVANHLQQHGVSAFIYPSARSDVTVAFEHGHLIAFSGWNLVDYRGLSSTRSAPAVSVMDTSPWCWERLPQDVTIAVPHKGSDIDGGFAIEGLVDYSGMHYVQQTRAARQLKRRIPSLFADGVLRQSGTMYVSWMLGRLSSRWLRSLLSRDQVAEDMQDLFAYAVVLDVYDIIGRVDDLSNMEMHEDWITTALATNVQIGSALVKAVGERLGDERFGTTIRLAHDLEQCLFYLWILATLPSGSLDNTGVRQMIPRMGDNAAALDVGEQIHLRLREVFVRAAMELSRPSAPDKLLRDGSEVAELVAQALLERVSRS